MDHIRILVDTGPIGTKQNFEIDNFGTPAAAIFILTKATTDDTITADAALAIGFTDGVNNVTFGVHSQDAQDTANTDRQQKHDRCILASNSTSVPNGEFSFDSWTANGIRLNVDRQFTAGYLLKVILFKDTDIVNKKAFNLDLGSSTSPIDHTALGFEFDAMFMAHSYSATPTSSAHSVLSYGVVKNDVPATPKQKSVAWSSYGTSGTGNLCTYASDTAALCAVLSTTHRWNSVISDVDSTGFTHTTTASTGADAICLALEFAAGIEFDVTDLLIPTSGNYSESSLSFQPTYAQLCGVIGPSALNTAYSGADSAGFFISSLTDTSVYTSSMSDKDEADPTICKSLSSDQFRVLAEDGATDAVLASAHSFTSSGLELTLTTNPAKAILGFSFSYGVTSGGGGGVTVTGSITNDDDIVSGTINSGSVTGFGVIEDDGDVVSGTISSESSVTKGVRVHLFDGDTPQANVSDVTAMWWDSSPPVGDPVYTTAIASIDSSGYLTLDVDVVTSLNLGEAGFLLLWKRDNTDVLQSPGWVGELLVEDIA